MSTFTEEEAAFGDDHPTLGADYKRAQAIAERFMVAFAEEHFKGLAEEFANTFRDKLWSDISSWFIADTECNLQTAIRQTVDATINALLTGKAWALERYPLSKYHDGQAIRAAIFEQHRDALETARIKDLEAEVARLKSILEFRR